MLAQYFIELAQQAGDEKTIDLCLQLMYGESFEQVHRYFLYPKTVMENVRDIVTHRDSVAHFGGMYEAVVVLILNVLTQHLLIFTDGSNMLLKAIAQCPKLLKSVETSTLSQPDSKENENIDDDVHTLLFRQAFSFPLRLMDFENQMKPTKRSYCQLKETTAKAS